MSYSSGEHYEVYDERNLTARKQHTCAACGESIEAGHRYTKVFTLYDGNARSIKRCARCQTLHLHLRDLDPYEELWPDEQLNCGSSYEDEWCEPPPDEIAALAFALPGEVKL